MSSLVRESINDYFIKMVKLVGTRATCKKKQVGCVLVNKKGHILATGYNGTIRDTKHCLDHPCEGECMAVHAEQNAFLQCQNVSDVYATYCSLSPCLPCAKLVANSGCQEFYYISESKHTEALLLLKEAGIKVNMLIK